MPENKFDLNKALQAAKLYNKIDYGNLNLNIPDVQQTIKNFENWRKSLGYKTEEEKQEDLKAEMQASQQRFNDQGLWNSEDPYEVYNAYQTNPEKQEEFRRKQIAKNLGLDFKDSKVSTSTEYQEAIVDMVNNWLKTPSNRGKTLVASTKHLLDPKYKIKFANEPFIPDFKTFVARNQARGFRETPEQLRKWYDSILEIKPDIKIDNRFTSEILNGQ